MRRRRDALHIEVMSPRAALARFEGLHYRAGSPAAAVYALGAWKKEQKAKGRSKSE